MDNPIGQILFYPREETFVEVTDAALAPPGVEALTDNRPMVYTDLKDGKQHSGKYVEDIGEVFFRLPKKYPRSRIKAYLKASADRTAADLLINDITHEIFVGSPED